MKEEWRALLELLAEELAGRGRLYGGVEPAAGRTGGEPPEGLLYGPAGGGRAPVAPPDGGNGAAAGSRLFEQGAEPGQPADLLRQSEPGPGAFSAADPFTAASGGRQVPLPQMSGGPLDRGYPMSLSAGGAAGPEEAGPFLGTRERAGSPGGPDLEALDRAVQRDARRYDGGFAPY